MTFVRRSMDTPRRGRGRVSSVLLGGLVALWASACAPDTGGRMIGLQIAVRAEADEAQPLGRFTTATGWDVTLDEALAAVGPVFIYENAPVYARRDERFAPLRWLVPLAHAHPGDSHYDGGVAKGEWLGQTMLDLLDPSSYPTVDAPGIAGEARSITVHLDPPRSSLAGRERLRGHQFYVSGVAEREGQRVPFAGGLDLPAEGDQRRVQGIPLSGVLDDGSRLVVAVHPSSWLREARFEELLGEEPGEDGRYPIPKGSQIERAWYIGARSLAPAGVPGSAFTAWLAEHGEEDRR
ncbi:hypothetical protein [Chondromyces crocatus]|uniref:Uncharacterized protein n=1 Tax=Chondromyces crocatus TaxID=52 RepID=A0A0K1EF10_CHOCO|nr:hypothetical protein [Chondromyces crocatus]AKT39439.1 uncharacterized protein CMC5_035860 [Chondromyces crocatus]